MPAEQEQQFQQGGYTVQFLLLKWLDRATFCRAQGDIDGYYHYFVSAIQLAQSYLPTKIRLLVQQGWFQYQTLYLEIIKIQNDASRTKNKHELMASFVDAHLSYCFQALNKMDVQRPQEDGLIDFSKMGYDKIAEIIRNPKIKLEEVSDEEVELSKKQKDTDDEVDEPPKWPVHPTPKPEEITHA